MMRPLWLWFQNILVVIFSGLSIRKSLENSSDFWVQKPQNSFLMLHYICTKLLILLFRVNERAKKIFNHQNCICSMQINFPYRNSSPAQMYERQLLHINIHWASGYKIFRKIRKLKWKSRTYICHKSLSETILSCRKFISTTFDSCGNFFNYRYLIC